MLYPVGDGFSFDLQLVELLLRSTLDGAIAAARIQGQRSKQARRPVGIVDPRELDRQRNLDLIGAGPAAGEVSPNLGTEEEIGNKELPASGGGGRVRPRSPCLLYTSDAADDVSTV